MKLGGSRMNHEMEYENTFVELKKKKRPKKSGYFLAGFLGALLGLITGVFGVFYYLDNFLEMPESETSLVATPINIRLQDEVYYAVAVAQKAMDSVVGIITKETYNNAFFGPQTTEGIGSGVIVSSDGFILTNSHVVSDGRADSIIVRLTDGTEIEGQVLWNNATLDLAIVKVEREGLQAAELGDSDALIIGEPVVAIGNPLSLQLDRTVTNGIISGLNRSINIDRYTVMKPLIQTNASINPGNSGGPLLNARGQVIGINTAKIISAEGLGFSIPINIARSLVEEMIAEGSITDVYMGIRGVTLAVYERQLNVSLSADYGVVVVETVTGSPAAKAGLQTGDVIQSINNTKIVDMGDIQRHLFKFKPNDEAELTIIRNGEEITLTIVFEAKPEDF